MSFHLVRLAVNLGYALGPLMGGFVAAKLGYNFLFIINALAIFIGGNVFYQLFKNKKHRVTEKEISAAEKKALVMPWNDSKYLIYLAFFTLTIVVFMQLLYTAPLYFTTEYGFDESLIGMLMAINGFIIAIVEMPLIFKLEQIIKPVICVVIGSVLMGLGFITFNFIAIPMVAALVYTVFLTFGEMLSFPFSNNYALSFSTDHNRGKYMGLYTMTFSTAHIIAPLLGLYMVEQMGYDSLWVGSAGLCLFAAFMILVTRKRVVVI